MGWKIYSIGRELVRKLIHGDEITNETERTERTLKGCGVIVINYLFAMRILSSSTLTRHPVDCEGWASGQRMCSLIHVMMRSCGAVARSGTWLQVGLHELQVNVPIRRDGAMTAGMHVIAERIADEFTCWW